jgi:hypothetical protein
VSAGERDAAERQHYVTLGDNRKNFSRIRRSSNRERRDRASVGNAEEHPAVKERDQIAIGLAQIDILSPAVWEHRAQFGESDTAEKRDQSTHDPNSHEQHRIRQWRCNIFGGEKNGRANDPAYQEQHGVQKRESADEARLRFRFAYDGLRRSRTHSLPHAEFVGGFEGSAAAAADHRRAVAAGERVGDFAGAARAVQQHRLVLR